MVIESEVGLFWVDWDCRCGLVLGLRRGRFGIGGFLRRFAGLRGRVLEMLDRELVMLDRRGLSVGHLGKADVRVLVISARREQLPAIWISQVRSKLGEQYFAVCLVFSLPSWRAGLGIAADLRWEP